jgi:hypothetical protein
MLFYSHFLFRAATELSLSAYKFTPEINFRRTNYGIFVFMLEIFDPKQEIRIWGGARIIHSSERVVIRHPHSVH